jgi:hypothetical protein
VHFICSTDEIEATEAYESQLQESDMNRLLVAMAALTFIATPVLAQSDPGISANIAPVYGQMASRSVNHDARNAAAGLVPAAQYGPTAVYDDWGHIYGADPDPNIRLQLHREAQEGEW